VLEAWNLILYRLDQQRAGHRASLLRWHSAFWDELQSLRLGSLDDYVLLVTERNPEEGRIALEYLRSSRQRWAAQAVHIELEARRLERADTVWPSVTLITAGWGSGRAPATSCCVTSVASARMSWRLEQVTVYHQRWLSAALMIA
jgi:hypothetical protein